MKYVCLDIGSVLCSVDYQSFIDLVSSTFNVSLADARRFLKRFQKEHDLGFTTMEDELKDHFNLKSEVTTQRLIQHWNECVKTHHGMMDMLDSLKQRYNLQVALLSNIGHEHALLMEDRLAWGGFFKDAVKHFSCDVGARKPTKLYYQSFLRQHPEFTGSIYVDDLQENLDASKPFGFQIFRLSLEESDAGTKIVELENLIINSR